MNTTSDNMQVLARIIINSELTLKVCNEKIEHLTHPELYGTCLCNCNSIVINKERMMTVTTDKTHHTTYEFSPLYPTFFSPGAANRIIKNDIYKDIHGKRIELEIVNELEYYRLLKKRTETSLDIIRNLTV